MQDLNTLSRVFSFADCDNVVIQSVWLVTYERESEWAEKKELVKFEIRVVHHREK